MPDPDIVIELPAGWEQLANPDGPLTYSPDAGGGVLQLSCPSWSAQLRGQPDDAVAGALTELVEGGQLGEVVAIGASDLEYGRALRADVASEEHGEVMAWLVVPATHDVVFATWIAATPGHADVARRIVTSLRPGLFSAAVAGAVNVAGDALAQGELSPHAVLFNTEAITRVDLAVLPHQIWDEACRVERARTNAEVVVQVLAATAGDRDVALIYAESEQRRRRLVVGAAGPTEIEPTPQDLFAAADPRVEAMLAAARE